MNKAKAGPITKSIRPPNYRQR